MTNRGPLPGLAISRTLCPRQKKVMKGGRRWWSRRSTTSAGFAKHASPALAYQPICGHSLVRVLYLSVFHLSVSRRTHGAVPASRPRDCQRRHMCIHPCTDLIHVHEPAAQILHALSAYHSSPSPPQKCNCCVCTWVGRDPSQSPTHNMWSDTRTLTALELPTHTRPRLLPAVATTGAHSGATHGTRELKPRQAGCMACCLRGI